MDEVTYSVTTDAVVRSVTVTFKLGEEVTEKTVGLSRLLLITKLFLFLDLRTVKSTFTFDEETCSLVWTSTDK